MAVNDSRLNNQPRVVKLFFGRRTKTGGNFGNLSLGNSDVTNRINTILRINNTSIS